MANFTQSDLEQIRRHGLTPAAIEKQLADFVRGFPYASIAAPAHIGSGIVELDENQLQEYAKIYDDYRTGHTIVKFVPASGAATRMFKDLFEYLSTGTMNATTEKVLKNLEQFAFYDELKRILPPAASPRDIISYIVTNAGLNYGNRPKGLIPFHKYASNAVTPAAEHLAEGAAYAASNGIVHVHFTVSPEHRDDFKARLAADAKSCEKQFSIQYDISMSQQHDRTDTIAVNPDNTPFRNDDGTLLFRPAGHGALIENLNEIDADIIFIKNIDNVCVAQKRDNTTKYKRALAGVLIATQSRAFEYLREIDDADASKLAEIRKFISDDLNVRTETQPSREQMREILNRPLRICGMCPNTGEPGGGPFWVRDLEGRITLQIVESAQIAPADRDIMARASHFNPVDLICGVRNYKGEKFNLTKFIDENTGFISEKSKNGRPLRAMERPGLWNGAMAHWNTIFVQVPNDTFTPVKVVSDLLLPPHKCA